MPELTQPTQEAGTKVQCLQKRKGGTQVTFGHHAATQTTYHFLPISNEPNAPHVAIVGDEEHLAALLAIPEGYRLYRGDNTPVTAIPKPSEEAPAIAFKNRFDDLLSIDFNNIENDEIKKWSEQVLKVKATQAKEIKARADDMGIDLSDNPPIITILRRIGLDMQKAEREASAQAAN